MPVKDVNTLYRSTFAIRAELQAPLGEAVKASGASSLSDLLSRLARAPEETGTALRPIFERLGGQGGAPGLSRALRDAKESGLTPQEIAILLRDAAAKKGAGNGGH